MLPRVDQFPPIPQEETEGESNVGVGHDGEYDRSHTWLSARCWAVEPGKPLVRRITGCQRQCIKHGSRCGNNGHITLD